MQSKFQRSVHWHWHTNFTALPLLPYRLWDPYSQVRVEYVFKLCWNAPEFWYIVIKMIYIDFIYFVAINFSYPLHFIYLAITSLGSLQYEQLINKRSLSLYHWILKCFTVIFLIIYTSSHFYLSPIICFRYQLSP